MGMLRGLFCSCFLIIAVSLSSGYGQTIWNGPKIVFEKADSADWLLEENQDRITDSIWITRQNNRGIFNIKLESSFDRDNRTSPLGTEWANGKIEDGIENLRFTTWHQTKLNSSAFEVGIDKVLHIISEDIYIDIKFLSWTSGGGGSGTGFGGGFSYQRSTPLTTSNEMGIAKNTLRIVQLHNHIELRSDEKFERIVVMTSVGEIVFKEESLNLPTLYRLSLTDFPSGMYIVLVDEKYWVKFIKR